MSTYIINADLYNGFKHLENQFVEIDNNLIKTIAPMAEYKRKRNDTVIDAKNNIVCPGLIDTHIHGFSGFGTEDISTESILKMSDNLVKYGVTSFVPTIYPNSRKDLIKTIDSIVSAIGKEKGARIQGIHVEGPFVSPKHPGALPKDSISPIDLKYFEEILKHGNGHILCMTVAPELEGIEKLAKKAKETNVVLLAGHSDATYEQMIKAEMLGIRHCTHLFNAMPALHHRNPGLVGAALTNKNICFEIIADGVHVNSQMVKLALMCKDKKNVVLITDSLKPNKQKKGPLFANGVEVVLSPKGAFVSKDNPDLLNGSALTLNKALDNLNKWDIGPEKTITMATANPARIYNLNKIGTIKKGYKADICIFDKNFNLVTAFVDGKSF